MEKRTLRLKITVKAVMLGILLSAAGKMYAYDFSAVCSTGQTLYYNIVDSENHFVELVYPGSYGNFWIGYTKPSGNLVLPNNVYNAGTEYLVTSIGETAFDNCYDIDNVVIPNSVWNIGDRAFSYCSGLTSIIIPNSITSIGVSAFDYNIGLEQIIVDSENMVYDSRENCNAIIESNTDELVVGCMNTIIPNSVVSIGNNAFHGCTGLTSIYIPCSVTSIGNDAFYYCTSLNSLTIPDSVTSIGRNAFGYCSALVSVTISNSVISIGDAAFRGCVNLLSLTIPSSVTSIGNMIVADCSKLGQIVVEPENTVFDSRDNCNAIIRTASNGLIVGCKGTVFPNTITAIEHDAFYGCNFGNYASIIIPDSVTSIGEGAFSHCTMWSVKIGASVTSIGNYAFYCCTYLSSITIPNSVISIGNFAFGSCQNLYSVVIPNFVVSIGDNAFYYCEKLNSLIIGNSTISIGTSAFAGCRRLTSLTIFTQVPPSIGSGAFSGISKSIPVYVPYGSVNEYVSTAGWNEFTNYKEFAYKSIHSYGAGNGNWQLISSPLIGSIDPYDIANMIIIWDYFDLYQFSPSDTLGEWQNYKADAFNLTNGQGYLYASARDVNIIYKGTFNEDESKVVELVYDEDAPNGSWNLVGNPFPVSAYIDRPYYVMNEDGSGIVPTEVSPSIAIPPCTGIFVKAEMAGETVTFSKTAPVAAPN